MNITITTLKQYPVSDEELYKLFLLFAPMTARCCYLFSFLVAHMTHHRNGQLNWFGSVVKKMRCTRN